MTERVIKVTGKGRLSVRTGYYKTELRPFRARKQV